MTFQPRTCWGVKEIEAAQRKQRRAEVYHEFIVAAVRLAILLAAGLAAWAMIGGAA